MSSNDKSSDSCVTIIVACDPNFIIGKGGVLPWRIPEDLRMFRLRTMGHAVIMGRKTWQSIPFNKKPLDGRANVVISKNDFIKPLNEDGPYYFGSLETAIREIRDWKGVLAPYACKTIYIIGGEQIYKDALDKGIVDAIIMSKTEKEYEGDRKFPEIESKWQPCTYDRRKGFAVIHYKKREQYE